VARSRLDASAFGELYDFYLPRIFGFVIRRVGDRTVAEDLTAMTFERALGIVRRQEFRNESFGGWLYRVAVNHCLNVLRRRRLRRWVSLSAAEDDDAIAAPPEPAEERADPHRELDARRRWGVVHRAINALPPNQRAVLVLARFEELSYKEIAETLGITLGAVESRLFRAMRALERAQEGGV